MCRTAARIAARTTIAMRIPHTAGRDYRCTTHAPTGDHLVADLLAVRRPSCVRRQTGVSSASSAFRCDPATSWWGGHTGGVQRQPGRFLGRGGVRVASEYGHCGGRSNGGLPRWLRGPGLISPLESPGPTLQAPDKSAGYANIAPVSTSTSQSADDSDSGLTFANRTSRLAHRTSGLTDGQLAERARLSLWTRKTWDGDQHVF